ncbi:polyferredoxin [Streptomyces turgidiscabies]|uniref:Polyferredoxin n=2 Tax=Streptomyces TaxID=1883 RepID=A0ABU0RN73_9ACTN|nr:polyferredoxin [Streptomyces turgidiscabies]
MIGSKSPTELKTTGVEMFTVVRERMCALVCRTRAVLVARRDAGMVTSEYAVGIIAAVAFAAVLYKVVTSGQVSSELQAIVKKALDAKM